MTRGMYNVLYALMVLALGLPRFQAGFTLQSPQLTVYLANQAPGTRGSFHSLRLS